MIVYYLSFIYPSPLYFHVYVVNVYYCVLITILSISIGETDLRQLLWCDKAMGRNRMDPSTLMTGSSPAEGLSHAPQTPQAIRRKGGQEVIQRRNLGRRRPSTRQRSHQSHMKTFAQVFI
ncbi:hypothetical protein JTE90_019477 [Oedothorax gibbosus]|uniref:Uncharacterized protein n=1 Tax=Oedothorax gibbosus TaxID=931172 RepID=A0AAV6TLV2_9ARAC|nr:hypothetical protein JTE90_019477 [Oedothorax gibbosus]